MLYSYVLAWIDLYRIQVGPTVHKWRAEMEELTGNDQKRPDLSTSRYTRSQVPAIDPAIRVLGSEKFRGHCLGMICADFLVGAKLDEMGHGSAQDLITQCSTAMWQFMSPRHASLTNMTIQKPSDGR